MTLLTLYDLLEPQFLTGVAFPDYMDSYLSRLNVVTLATAYDETGIVYSGRLAFGFEAAANIKLMRHVDPKGSVWHFEALQLDFRLTLPRDGNEHIHAVAQLPDPTDPAGLLLPDLDRLLEDLGPVEQAVSTPTDYPGTRFKLELLLETASMTLGASWVPGRLDANHRIVHDTKSDYKSVKIRLPRMLFEYSMGEDLTQPVAFRPRAWGNIGFDAPSDLNTGELIRMEPAIALHESDTVAFSLNQVQIDLSEEHTPLEILEHFGVDESWTGLYIKNARLFVESSQLDIKFNAAVNDLLISSEGEVSFEASLDLFMMRDLSLFRMDVRFFNNGESLDDQLQRTPDGGSITLPQTAVAQVEIGGGAPAYTISAKIEGQDQELWQDRQIMLSPQMFTDGSLRPSGQYTLVVTVTDALERDINGYFEVTLVAAETALPASEQDGSPLDRPPDTVRQPAEFKITLPAADSDILDGYMPTHEAATNGTREKIVIPGPRPVTVTTRRDGAEVEDKLQDESFYIEVEDGDTFTLTIKYPAVSADSVEGRLYFGLGRPYNPTEVDLYTLNQLPFTDTRFSGSPGLRGAAGLHDWLRNNDITGVEIKGYASYEPNTDAPAPEDNCKPPGWQGDLELSQRRFDVAAKIVRGYKSSIQIKNTRTDGGCGHDRACLAGRKKDPADRVVEIMGTAASSRPSVTIEATIERDSRAASPPPAPGPIVKQTDPSPDFPDDVPPIIRRLSCRVKLERNVLVFLELSGQVDFETEVEKHLRKQGQVPANADLPPCAGELDEPNPDDGLIDVAILFVYDPATKELTITLAFDAAEGNLDGLCQFDNPRGQSPTSKNIITDALGAALLLAPILNAEADAFDPESAGDWVMLSASLALPAALVGAGFLRTEAITFYGIEFKVRQYLPTIIPWPPEDPYRLTGLGALIDYAVAFRIVIDALGIKAKVPLRVRYKAVGFFLHMDVAFSGDGVDLQKEVRYQPIFDTSKGYDFELTDPAVFELPPPLGTILEVFSARMARFNPLTLELDLALKIDLGAAVGGRFLVTAPLDGSSPPMIMPSMLYLKIPGAIEATGYINIVNTVRNPQWAPIPGGHISNGDATDDTGTEMLGIEGMLDLSLPSMGLRITASVGVVLIDAPDRFAAAVFVGFTAEFPAPIPLWTSGVAIYGFSGLFAMHYNRQEDPRGPGDSVSPALRWLIRAGGNPPRLVDNDGEKLWDVELDRWSAGIGIVLGTTVSEILINFGGMLIFELPGPRVLIFVKIQVITVLPSLDDAQLAVGVLGVIDLDFYLGQLTIGVMISFSIEKLIVIQVPVEIFFKFSDLTAWHLYAGTIGEPATADLLGIVRGRGYLMIKGNGIVPFPPPDGQGLPGVAVVIGLEAVLRFGEGSIYAEVVAGAHLGAAFAPFFIAGKVYLLGSIHIFIASIEASAVLNLEAPDPVYIYGEICGRIDLWFKKIEACIPIEIGDGARLLAPPDLVRGVYLQSHAPVLTHGQASDRPIDASLGYAASKPDDDLIVVPIDSVPVIQFFGPPRLAPGLRTFSEPLPLPPNTADPEGWIEVGNERQVRYILEAIELDPPLYDSTPLPPATWRLDGPPEDRGVATSVDLAFFSRVPTVAERALERSSTLEESVGQRWEQLCAEPAPPTCVLWTFCGQPFGPSGEGWELAGTPLPDPPGTTRRTPPPTSLLVEPPPAQELDELLDLLLADSGVQSDVPAQIIGLNRWDDPAPESQQACISFEKLRQTALSNPALLQGVRFLALDERNRPFAGIQISKGKRFQGIRCEQILQIRLPDVADRVELTLAGQSLTQINAVNQRGRVIESKQIKGDDWRPKSIVIEARGIAGIVLRAKRSNALLLELCWQYGSPQSVVQTPENFACLRALQLPFTTQVEDNQGFDLADPVMDAAELRGNRRLVTIHTGAATEVNCYLALRGGIRDQMTLRELDGAGALLRETPLSAFNLSPVDSLTDLPVEWHEPALPWREQVVPIVDLFAHHQYQEYGPFVVSFTPLEKMASIQLITETIAPNQPQVLLGAITICPRAEEQRVQVEREVQLGEIALLEGYLGGNDVVPLLQPDETYRLTIRYRVESKDAEGEVTAQLNMQSFRFHTDDAPPARLDPYMLGTTPHHEATLHFYEDPCFLIFNDAAVEQLYATYGRTLHAVVRTADGVQVETSDSAVTLPDSGPLRISIGPRLSESPAEYRITPYRATLGAYSDEHLPCVEGSSGATHGVADLPFRLRPLMAYTVNMELDPPDPPGLADSVGEAVTPLFRFNFTTSRYPTVAAFAEAIQAAPVRMRSLQAPAAGLPAPSPGSSVAVASDQALQEALLAAGEELLGAATEPGLTLYWVPTEDGPFRPYALLIDVQEPLWRTRPEPRLETVLNAAGEVIDPAYQRIVTTAVPALEVIATQAGVISHFVSTQGGTRVLAMLAPLPEPPPAQLPVRLALHRAASSLFGIDAVTETILDMTINTTAPWEADDE